MGYHLLFFGLPAFGIYALASHCLRKKPHLLHKRHRFPVQCRHVSHRGGSGERIENTMEAFRHALNQGTNLLEIDCHMTKDGVVVVSHDNNLERQTGYNIEITLLCHPYLPFPTGCFSHGRDHRIPSLEEVFQEFPGVPINIEIKEDNDELIQKVADLVRYYNRSHISIWASFEGEVLKKCCTAVCIHHLSSPSHALPNTVTYFIAPRAGRLYGLHRSIYNPRHKKQVNTIANKSVHIQEAFSCYLLVGFLTLL
uniref:Glycerophosphodiester phosphodiesterase domain containing 3 n=1 Tax=Varanus komodoensis TaxID=61221 RepID=A0A8D2JDE3_VARKO